MQPQGRPPDFSNLIRVFVKNQAFLDCLMVFFILEDFTIFTTTDRTNLSFISIDMNYLVTIMTLKIWHSISPGQITKNRIVVT